MTWTLQCLPAATPWLRRTDNSSFRTSEIISVITWIIKFAGLLFKARLEFDIKQANEDLDSWGRAILLWKKKPSKSLKC